MRIRPAIKVQMLATLFAATVLLAGCSTTKFTENHGSEVFQGKGGTPYAVDGIDFWETGDSDRTYKILGVIEDSHKVGGFSALFGQDRNSAIAKIARQQHGDAVIFAGVDPEPASAEMERHGNHHRHTKYLVVKYLD